MSQDSNLNVGKGPFVYEQTYLANLQAYQDSVVQHCGLYGLIASTVTCKCLILTDKKI